MNIEKIKNITFDKYKITKEYPEIIENKLSEEEINLIKNIYSGSKSEMTSLNQYMYQHILLYNTLDLTNFSHAMEEIAITEMLHFEILGKLLLKCNVDPKFCTFIDNNPSICNFWSSSKVNYSTTLNEILLKNIELENIGIREYKKLLELTSSSNIKDLVTRIIEDEESHIKYFNEILSNI